MRRLLAVAISAVVLTSAVAAAEPDFSLTVYSSAQPGQIDSQRIADYGDSLPGYALVSDQRVMRIAQGRSDLRFEDVAARMDPTTVSFASLTDPAGTRVLEQNYQYDLVSGQKLLQRFIGEQISVEQLRGERVESITGRLLSAQDGVTLQLANGELSTLSSWSGIRYPSLPGGLITKPTLVWTLDAAKGGDHRVRVGYQAQGLTWWADYNATLDESKGCSLDLGAWVTVVNQSGGSFPNARLKLVAGDVNRAPAAPPPMAYRRDVAMMAAAPMQDGFAESALFEYHLYTLGRRTDLPDRSTKQIELFPAISAVKCEKQLVFTAAPAARVFWGTPNLDQGYAATSPGEVGAYLQFENSKDNGMGMPLPAGRVRVNQLGGSDGSLEFIGEDVIRHTPRNEQLGLKLGKSFDIVGERRQVDYRVDTTAKWLEETFEISVRNRKDTAATVQVREYLYRWSSWKIGQSTHKHTPRDAQTIDFPLDIPADGEVKVRYTVRYSW